MKKQPRPSQTTQTTKATNDSDETLAIFGPVARSSVVDAVADRLRGEILAGRLAPGSRLPSERELSLALGVNRLTLRAALARLEAMGLVTKRHGSGTEVAPWRERAGLEALGMVISSLDPHEPAWLDLLTSLLEIRRILAAEAVALACDRHTTEDLEVMARIASEQFSRVHDAIAYARGDVAFQRAMARAAGNVGIELILNSIARFPEEHPGLVASLYDRREEAVHFYGAVMDLVRAGNGDAARIAVKTALRAVDDEWLRRHGYVMARSALASASAKKAKDR
ncbi:MAG: FadR family transcriptional regulator [Polyangiaceae bacterium]|nr:FadR family transcriptional regulator [Polyangiaceae bacterium]